jgi:hypothetical protein
MNTDSNEAITRAKEEIEVRRLRREEKLDTIEHYLGFAATKASGAALLIAGLVEFLSPDFISAILPQPLAIAGVGFALLVGKRGARQLLNALEQFVK